MFAWLKRKSKNRRSQEREQVLDVKLRTSQTRAAKMRMAGVGMTVIFCVALVALVLWRGGKWVLDGLIYENDAFAIQQIEVQTDGVLTPETIRAWARVRPGQNLMALDLLRVKRDLESQPPIQFVAIERVLQHTLKITVNEREPVAQTMVTQVHAGGATDVAVYDFDEDGYVMRPLDPRWRTVLPAANERLPILMGVPASEPHPGKQITSAQIRAALALVGAFDHSPMTGLVEIERIDVSQPDILKVITSQKAEITFSLSHFDTQLRHWRLIYDQFQRSGQAIASLDLSISNNLPVHLVAAASVPPVAPRALQPSRPKRKHV
ncbi:MAG TPA: FtsQ-type POTRA domain-containing protein [Verrucomicrobiae bacterium]|jgi:cell division septal protein FtsQ|nr:FtsQ-type POTRA domain-containing protein [Verrucomicrobiae bacterium]